MIIDIIFKRLQTDTDRNVEIFCDYDCGKDLLVIRYDVNGIKYDIVFANISALKTVKDRDFLIKVVNTNIQYHIDEQENKEK